MLKLQTSVVALLGLLAGACSTLDSNRPYWQKGEATASPLESMIAYHAYAAALGNGEWQRENTRLTAAARQSADETLCVRQAILASAPAAPERARATSHFEQCERELRKRDSRLLGLLVLLRSEYNERQRADERAREAARRAEELAQKLNDLKAIEKNLLERSPPAARMPKP